jgi:hypothetical protein
MRYTAEQGSKDGFRTIRLTDTQSGVSAQILPEAGNNAFSLQVGEQEFLWRPK